MAIQIKMRVMSRAGIPPYDVRGPSEGSFLKSVFVYGYKMVHLNETEEEEVTTVG